MIRFQYMYGCLLFLFIGTVDLTAQNEEWDRLMTRRRLTCYDREENCRILIPQYHIESKFDSLRQLLRYWERTCGTVEPITRMEIILDAGAGRIEAYPFSTTTIHNLLRFKRKTEFARKNPEYKEVIRQNLFWYSTETINDQFDLFTALEASRVRDASSSSFTGTVMDFYAGNTDSLFVRIHDDPVTNSPIRPAYDSVVASICSELSPYMGLTAGYWMPNGNAALLGDHPELGFEFGGMKRGYHLEMMLAIRFLKAQQQYVVHHNGSPMMTDNFFGGYIAGHFGLDLWTEKMFDLSILSGIAYDGFDAVEATRNTMNDGKSINSLNVNLGIGGRIYTEELRGNFINVEIRYHAVNYVNRGGTDLSGDAVTVRIGYSWSSSNKYALLRELGAY